MQSLHDYLCQKAKFYRDWHGHPLTNATHWSAFVAISLVMTASLLSSVNAYAQTVDDQVSNTADSSSTTPDITVQNPIVTDTSVDSTTTTPTIATTTSEVTPNIVATTSISTSSESVSTTTISTTTENVQATSTSAASILITSTSTGSVPIITTTATTVDISTTTQNNSVPLTVASSSVATINSFSVPSIVMNSLVVPITHFEVSDSDAVAGYLITNSAETPSADSNSWNVTVPTSYVSATGGTKTLYAWVKNTSGIVSPSASARVTIMLIEN